MEEIPEQLIKKIINDAAEMIPRGEFEKYRQTGDSSDLKLDSTKLAVYFAKSIIINSPDDVGPNDLLDLREKVFDFIKKHDKFSDGKEDIVLENVKPFIGWFNVREEKVEN